MIVREPMISADDNFSRLFKRLYLMMPSEPDDIYYQIFCSANFVQISLLFTVTVFNFFFFFPQDRCVTETKTSRLVVFGLPFRFE